MKKLYTLLALAGLSMSAGSLSAQTRDYGYTFDTPATLRTDGASWNYTLNELYPGSGDPGATENMLIVRGESGSSDHSVVTVGDHTGYFVRTANTQNANFGFYLMNLDFRDLDVGVDVVVNYSFKILGNDTNSSIDPNDWNVRYATGTTTVGVSAFSNVAQTFDFNDDNATWTTISGSFMITSGTGSSRGGILINDGTSTSGATSTGGYYLADLSVQVDSVAVIPEPSSFALIAGFAALAGITLRRRR
ncbi:MAG: PEP-CTERM sorting domain-containing protein [Verrucomicrobiota bacterium]